VRIEEEVEEVSRFSGWRQAKHLHALVGCLLILTRRARVQRGQINQIELWKQISFSLTLKTSITLYKAYLALSCRSLFVHRCPVKSSKTKEALVKGSCKSQRHEFMM